MNPLYNMYSFLQRPISDESVHIALYSYEQADLAFDLCVALLKKN